MNSKWQTKSNDDINVALTVLIHDCEKWGFNDTSNVFYHCGIDGSKYHEQPVVNFCGNPSRAWMHILNNHITITPRMGNNPGDATGYSKDANPVTIEFDANEEALRAALICLLEVNGVTPNE